MARRIQIYQDTIEVICDPRESRPSLMLVGQQIQSQLAYHDPDQIKGESFKLSVNSADQFSSDRADTQSSTRISIITGSKHCKRT
jgi:hypothetical protein